LQTPTLRNQLQAELDYLAIMRWTGALNLIGQYSQFAKQNLALPLLNSAHICLPSNANSSFIVSDKARMANVLAA